MSVPTADRAGAPALQAKQLHQPLRPLTEIRRVWVEVPCWSEDEAAALTVLLLKANSETCTVNCATRPERYSTKTLIEHAKLKRSPWFRALRVLEKQAKVVTRERVFKPGSKEIAYVRYVLHPDRLAAWAGEPVRPKAWDPPPVREDVVPGWDHPPGYLDKLEAVIAAGGLSRTDPKVAQLVHRAKSLDERARRLALAEERLRRRRAAHEGEAAALLGEVSDLGAKAASGPPVEAAPPAAPLPSAPPESAPAAEDAYRREQDALILATLQEHAPLAPLATEAMARKLGDTAVKAAAGRQPLDFLLIRRALERFAQKIASGAYKADLAAARAFLKRQWAVEHSPIRLPKPPQVSGEAAVVLEEVDPTPEELSAMRQGLSAIRGLPAVNAGAPPALPPRALPVVKRPPPAKIAPPARGAGGGLIEWVEGGAALAEDDARALHFARAVEVFRRRYAHLGNLFDATFSSVQLVDLSGDALTLGVGDELAAGIVGGGPLLLALLASLGEIAAEPRAMRVRWARVVVTAPIVRRAGSPRLV